MRNLSLVFIATLLIFTSCVTNRKFLYFQNKNELKEKKPPVDSVLRKYDLADFNYRIQTNDILSVRFQSLTAKEFDFMGGQTLNQPNAGAAGGVGLLLAGDLVDEKGEIPVPVIGKVKVAGLTVFQIQDTLQALANVYLQSPIVKVRLLNYRVTFLGEVNKEGSVPMGNNRVSLMEAIGLAGGLNELADRSNIKVVRQTGSRTEVYYVNILKEDFMNSPHYYVYQNDLIIVPPLKQRPFRAYFGTNFSLILSSISFLLVIYSIYKR
ncbi:MAG TPA: polysaccharide biosynthesis/export family protein [Cyclobacteriaceae bacterium]|nr:polysaccharide biosynthesis/export family protein [Cyclobacteriaceae bacterium]